VAIIRQSKSISEPLKKTFLFSLSIDFTSPSKTSTFLFLLKIDLIGVAISAGDSAAVATW